MRVIDRARLSERERGGEKREDKGKGIETYYKREGEQEKETGREREGGTEKEQSVLLN